MLDNIVSQRFIPILVLLLIIIAGCYLIYKTFKNRKENSTVVNILILSLSFFMVSTGLYILLFTVTFGMNT